MREGSYLDAGFMVFRNPLNLAVCLLLFVTAAFLLAWSGQIVSFLPLGGLYFDPDPLRVAAIAMISALLAVVVVLEIEVFRKARSAVAAKSGAGVLGGSVAAIAALSCCSPLLIPAIIGIFGATGTTALSVNLALRKLFLPLSLLAMAMLLISGVFALRDLVKACELPGPEPG